MNGLKPLLEFNEFNCQLYKKPDEEDRVKMKLLKESVKLSGILLIIFSIMFFGACSKKIIIPETPAQKQDTTGEDLFLKAQKALQTKSYEKARELFKLYIQKFPAGPHINHAMLKRGDICMYTGSPDDAVYYYAKAWIMSGDTEKTDAYEKLGQAFHHLDPERAESLINSVKDTKTKNFIRELSKKFVYDRFTVGCILPLSGKYQDFGHRALKGIELALQEFNSDEINPRINIVIKDTELNPEKASFAVNELHNKYQAACIIGPIMTAEQAALEAQALEIPIITLTQKDEITEIGDYVFRNFFTPEMHVHTLVNYAVDVLNADRFAILYPDEKYGTTFMNLFWDKVIDAGGKIVGLESYAKDQTDFADHVKKLTGLYYDIPENLKDSTQFIESLNNFSQHSQNNFNTVSQNPIQKILHKYGPLSELFGNNIILSDSVRNKEPLDKPDPIVDFEVLFIPDAPKKAGLIIPQLAYNDVLTPYIFGTNLWHSDDLIKMCSKYVQGAIMPEGFFAKSSYIKVKEFVKYFQRIYDEKPEFIEAIAYDTAMIIFKTISSSDVRSRQDIKEHILNLSDFEGVTGKTSFNSAGDVEKTSYLLKVKGNRFVQLEQ